MNEAKTEPTNGKMKNIIEAVCEDKKLNQTEKDNKNLCSPSELLLNIAMAAIDYNFENMVNNAVVAKITQIKEESTKEALKLVDETVKENERLKDLNKILQRDYEQKIFELNSQIEGQNDLNDINCDSAIEIQKLKEEKTELETYLKNYLKNSASTELALKEENQRLKETCQRATEEARKLKEENILLQVDSDKIVKQSEENQRLSSLIKERDGKLLDLVKSCEEKKKSNQLLKDKISEISRNNNLLQDAVKKASTLEKENIDLLEQLREERRKNQALMDKMRKRFEDDLMAA